MGIGAGAGIKAGVDLGKSLIENTGNIIEKGQKATEDRKWGKQKRKQDQTSFNTEKGQTDFYNKLQNTEDIEQVRKNELNRSDQGDSLLGRWNNESKDYNLYKNQVDADLRKSGAIKSEEYKDGKSTKTKDVYSDDFAQQQGDAYKKITGYDMTRDNTGKLIASQSWDDVNKIDEAIIAGEHESKKKKKFAYGVNGAASFMNR